MSHDAPNHARADDFLTLVRRAQRGRIKVYIGSSAGVGKTFRMLQEAHQLVARGVDVVIGFVETHGRPETAELVEGLEVIPPKKVRYHDIDIEELDVDAVLARKPAVVIVDELPHTNPPGFRHRWRYEDVEELADAGIHVICAMNVQHLGSLGELVFRATGVRVHETVPDAFLRDADQVVNLDISAEDLIERLRAGKIYPQERVEQALSSFFRPENLETLRELALREVAESIDRRQVSRHEPQGIGKVMACVASRSPNPGRIVERASRIAGRLNTHWYVVHVKTPQESGYRLDSEAERKLHDVLEMAQRMGAEVVKLEGADVVASLLAFARGHGVEHILMGRSLRSRWQEVWREGPLIRLIRAADDIDVQVVPMSPASPNRPGPA
ncbi:MAG: universal stress protein [Pseudomonadota bacterium]|nr:universal stress protein [Pseudomonadota bacterium]